MTEPMTMTRNRCQRVLAMKSSGSSARPGSKIAFAEELDVSAHGEEADPVIRLSLFDPEQPFAVAEGEHFDPDADQLGHEKMAEFVDEDEDAEDDQEGKNRAEESCPCHVPLLRI